MFGIAYLLIVLPQPVRYIDQVKATRFSQWYIEHDSQIHSYIHSFESIKPLYKHYANKNMEVFCAESVNL